MKPECREIVIGDVHGCYDEFLDLLKAIAFSPQDQIIFVGDVIDKGPKSYEMLQFIASYKNQIQLIKGNHEQKFIDYCNKTLQRSKPRPLFDKLIQQLEPHLDTWLQYIDSWPLYLINESYIVVHAGIPPETAINKVSPHILMNIRTWDGKGEDIKNPSNPAWHSFYKDAKLIIYGHWGLQGLHRTPNTLGLDSGCVYGNSLTAYIPREDRVIQVPAHKNYMSSIS